MQRWTLIKQMGTSQEHCRVHRDTLKFYYEPGSEDFLSSSSFKRNLFHEDVHMCNLYPVLCTV